ncbi:MAG: hypothetical protein AAGJ73_16440, partial [Pseudomonadota bacterium]
MDAMVKPWRVGEWLMAIRLTSPCRDMDAMPAREGALSLIMAAFAESFLFAAFAESFLFAAFAESFLFAAFAAGPWRVGDWLLAFRSASPSTTRD